jgi:hypothetical protein
MRRVYEEGRWPLCGEEEDAVHKLLKCSETRTWREQFWVENGLLLTKK